MLVRRVKNQKDPFKQPELNKSMTALHHEFIKTKNEYIREKLSVMNLRHNLSSILVYKLYKDNIYLNDYININKILYRNLRNYSFQNTYLKIKINIFKK